MSSISSITLVASIRSREHAREGRQEILQELTEATTTPLKKKKKKKKKKKEEEEEKEEKHS